MGAQSLFWSIDSVVNVCIYFSKFIRKHESDSDRQIERAEGIRHIRASTALTPQMHSPLGHEEEEVVRHIRASTVLTPQMRFLLGHEEEEVEENEMALFVCSDCRSTKLWKPGEIGEF